MSSTVAHLVAALGLLAMCVTAGGCSAGRISDENSRLRRENLGLTEKVDDQSQQMVRLQGQIDALTNKLNTPRPAVPGVKASDIPVATRITFGRYSGALDDDGDGKADTVRVYVLTEDQKGRFIPVAGKAVLQIVMIDANAGAQELVRKNFDPKALDEAFTSGLAGTHYTFESAVSLPAGAQGDELTVKVSLTDAATGSTLTAQTTVAAKP